MQAITARDTKATILAAYEQQRAILQAGASWPQVWAKIQHTAQAVSRETVALVKDCYAAGQWTRRCYDQAKAELIRPIFKS